MGTQIRQFVSNSRIVTPRVKKSDHFLFKRFLLSTIAVSALSLKPVHAQSVSSPDNGTLPPPAATAPALNDIIVTGTRETGTKARASSTPIQVISGKQLQETGAVTLRDALKSLAPTVAFEAHQGDLAALTDEFTIHGLSANHVLVLVNGKRRHTTANIQLDGGPGQGNTGVDIDLIPVSAIDHIEVLLGGDSAQYGSDAIAGVVNIILKSADHGGSAQANVGKTYEGDGFQRDVAVNAGASLLGNGYVNLSGEYAGQDHTFRTNTYAAQQIWGRPYNKITGNPAYNRELLSANTGYYFGDGTEIYGFATYGHRDAASYENHRNPNFSQEVPVTIFPGGFDPLETIDENDFSATAGVKGDNLLGWHWDLSSTYGEDIDSVGLTHSFNPDLWFYTGYSPTSFHIQDITNSEWANNLDLTRSFNVPALAAPLTVSWGGEHLLDGYKIGAGDPDSYYRGGSASYVALQPSSAGNHYRNSEAGYVDLSTKIIPEWKIDLAGRFEHYSDSGNTFNGGITTRYDFNQYFALRGNVNTGFQAPTLAEEYFSNLNVSPTGASGQLAPNSSVAKGQGASSLKPERSTNFSVGAVISPIPNANVTIDAYQININNRIVDGGTAHGQAAIDALASGGITLPGGLVPANVSASYFINGVDTRTRGIDIDGHYFQYVSDDWGSINWTLGANINDTAITGVKNNALGAPAVNQQQKSYITEATPKYVFTLGADWETGKFGLSLKEHIYGPTGDELTYYTGPNAFSSTVFYHFKNPVAPATDIEARYRLINNLEIAVGADNLFNQHPKTLPLANEYIGEKYDANAAVGWDGGLYYARVRYVF
jgi:iron complex outermembrane receptor protein